MDHGRSPVARKRRRGGRNQEVGETHLETEFEAEKQKGIKAQRRKTGGRERRQYLCVPPELSFNESI